MGFTVYRGSLAGAICCVKPFFYLKDFDIDFGTDFGTDFGMDPGIEFGSAGIRRDKQCPDHR